MRGSVSRFPLTSTYCANLSASSLPPQMLQNTAYMARVLKVIWPSLHIDDYLPLPATSNSVSPTHDANSVHSMQSAHSNSGVHTNTSTSITNTNAGIPETIVPAAPTSSPVASPRDRKYSMDSTVTFESGDGDSDVDAALSDDEAELIGPMPDDNNNTPTITTSTSNNNVVNTSSTANNTTTSISYSIANRPIDGLRFLRELFAMSKFLQPEKRSV